MDTLETQSSVVSAEQFDPIVNQVKEQFNVTTVVSVLALGIGASVGLAFVYWGGRKLVSMIMNAFRKGKVSI